VQIQKTKRTTGANAKEDRTGIWTQSSDGTQSFRGRHFGVMA
jgi:hypothetical protein